MPISPTLPNPPTRTSMNEQLYEREKKRYILIIPLKSVRYRAEFVARVFVRNLNGAPATWLLSQSISLLFFSFSSSSGHIARKLQTTNPGDFTGANDLRKGRWERGSVSSNSFGKAPSSVKIKGTVERFTAGWLREKGDHLRTELSPCQDKTLLAIRSLL